MSSSHSPLAQFAIEKYADASLMGFDLSITNSTVFMILTLMFACVLFFPTVLKSAVIPTRMQALSETIYDFVLNMITDNAGQEARKYQPFVFSMFIYVLLANLLGMIPYGFTVTSHIIVTLVLAMIVFFVVIVSGFKNHGMHFFSIFAPSGTPMWLMPLMIVIELFTFLARPFTLSIRLAGNMMSGHILMKVLASFVIGMGAYWGWVPIPFMALMSGFEIFVAVLQAYIFSILTCVYLNTAINLH